MGQVKYFELLVLLGSTTEYGWYEYFLSVSLVLYRLQRMQETGVLCRQVQARKFML